MKIIGDRSCCCLSCHICGDECSSGGCGHGGGSGSGGGRRAAVVVAGCLFEGGNDASEPLGFGARVMLVEELFHAFVSAHEIEVDNEREFLEIDGTQEHGLFEVLFQMARAVHATVQVDAMLHAEQMARLVNE